MTTHYLKTVQPFFSRVETGDKTAELRRDDRPYEIGDTLVLQEYDKATEKFSGREITVRITDITRHKDLLEILTVSGLVLGWCMLSFRKINQNFGYEA